MTEPAGEEAKRVRAAKKEHLEEVVMDLNRALVKAIRRNQSKEGAAGEGEMQEGTFEDAESTPNSSRTMNTVELQALCVFKLC
jgi:hypothetical protein